MAAVFLATITLSIPACSGTSPRANNGAARASRTWTPAHTTAAPAVDSQAWGATSASPCAGTDESGCMFPFPNDYYSAPDASMPTGRRIAFPVSALPVATGASPLDPAPWEDNDGFSPGSVLLTHVPGVSLARTGVATIGDIGRSLDARSPVVLLDTDTGQRWPTWAELDVTDHDPATQLLMIHPAQNLTEGHHYLVALRDLRDSSGRTIAPEGSFAGVLSGWIAKAPAAATPGSTATAGVTLSYATHLYADLRALEADGVALNDLFLAWDFTVASTQNLTAPALAMRDQAFTQLGAGVPSYSVTSVTNDPTDDPWLSREIAGTFETTSFLDQPGGPDRSVLNLGLDGLPRPLPGNEQTTAFHCEIPKTATSSHPGHVGIYGHGLFGSSEEVFSSSVPEFSDAFDYVFCGTDWLGLSSTDLGLATAVVTNLADFPSLVDHLMQSLVDAQFLGRLMDDPAGFAANAAFQAGGKPLIDPGSGLVYYGNSEGGIMGGALTALSSDIHRAVLGVPGMDYAILLRRSADFSPFQGLLDHAYPNRATQDLGFDIIQMLWDRGEADGYVEQLTGGLPGTPSHQVLLGEAFGDHQVANIATETEARTLEAEIHEPALRLGRSTQQEPYWDLAALPDRSRGPALFVWDSGVPAAPDTDVAPSAGPDPHDTVPRSVGTFWNQMNTFFVTGSVVDPCGDRGCKAPYPSG
jgi:hypothetical protein